MTDFLKGLNPVQHQAVTTIDGPVLVIAGPGSGKTRVLTFRIAYLLSQGVRPSSILALTFTNKAAREMKERIGHVAGPHANQVWAGTFHSLFSRILRIEAEEIGYPSDFTIYDSEDSKNLIASIIKEWNMDKEAYPTNGIRNRISSAKSNLLTPRAYEANAEQMANDAASRIPQFYKIYAEYVARCKRAGAMDFDDLLLQFFRLLQEKPEIATKYRERFRYIMVDEFQDTNFLQYGILKKLTLYNGSPRNICAVGDDAQSIYAFRGATIDNILDFEKDFTGLQTFKLEQNYRSTRHIVEAANKVIGYNKRQIRKTIWTDQDEGQKIRIIKAINDTEEGRRVIDAIMELKTRDHLPNHEIAILYRTNAQSRIFEEHLRRHNIAYKIFGGQSFYQRKEVKDLIAYLRAVVNHRDEEALKRVINFPKRGIGNSTMSQMAELAAAESITLWDALVKAGPQTRSGNAIAKFIEMMQRFREKTETLNAYDLALWVAKESRLYDEYASDHTIEGISRKENIQALLDGIQEFTESDEEEYTGEVKDKSLASYLQNIALLTDADEGTDETDYVSLMSVHAAKGLEFLAIFLVGLEEQLFPSFMAMNSQDEIDEERRLFYVAITRAKAHLWLTFAQSRYRYGQMRYNEPSRFLDEIDVENLEDTGGMVQELEASLAPKARVAGAPRPTVQVAASVKAIDPSTFRPSPASEIEAGMNVLHMKFGEGLVKMVDGARDNRVATIYFSEIDNPERRIMLKFAKLMIVE
ncbi:MAG: UvrD-helicase domain-containing protein [Saprospiraceae bacterium]|nr:UvrD-helicase domain-containing protein [Saprospiraceae bacterium]